MAVKIRLRAFGRKRPDLPYHRRRENEPARRQVHRDHWTVAPRLSADALKIDTARANHWLEHGAQPSDTVRSLLRRAGILKQRHELASRASCNRRQSRRRVGRPPQLTAAWRRTKIWSSLAAFVRPHGVRAKY